MAVTYLRLFPAVNQFELRNGMLNVAGRLYVYYQGTDDLADIYDEDGRQLQQPAILDSDGRAPGLFVDSARVYWLKVCDRYDDQQYTVEKMVPSGGGAGSALGTEVSIVSTDGSLTIDENTSGGVKTFDIAVSEDSTQLLEWCKLSGLNTLDSDGDLAFSFASGNMAVEGGQLKLRDDSYYHITTHFDVKPDAQGNTYDTLTFTLYKVDSENNTLLLRTFTYDVDSSVSDMVEVEYSTDVMTEGELKVYWNVTGIADGITVTIGDVQVHRVYSGIPRLPESTFATEEWVTDNFQTIGNYLSATESANYLLTSQSGMFQPSGDYLSATESSNYLLTSQSSLFQQAGDYLSATESANYLLTSQSGMFQPSGYYQPSGEYLSATESSNYYSTSNPSGFITGVDLSNYATTGYVDSSVSGKADSSALTAYQEITGMSAYQPSGDYYSASNPSGFITGVDLSDYATTAYVDSSVSGKLDTTAFNSGDFYSTSNPSGFITGVDLSNYATTGYVDSSVSGKQDASGMSAYALSADVSGCIDTVSTNSASWGSGVSLPITGTNGIESATYADSYVVLQRYDTAGEPDIRTAQLTPDQLNLTYTIDENDYYVMTLTETGLGFDNPEGYTEVTPYSIQNWDSAVDTVSNNSATWEGVTAKQDASSMTAYQEVSGMTAYQLSGDYYSASNPSGFITGVDLTPYQLTADMSGYLQTSESANYLLTSQSSMFITSTAGCQPVGDYLSATESANYLLTSQSGMFQPSGEYQTAGNYQTAGDYLSATESANYYLTSNPSGFITTAIIGIGEI